jgi:hypothetical protein
MVINVIRENPCFFSVIRGLFFLLTCAESNSPGNSLFSLLEIITTKQADPAARFFDIQRLRIGG